METLNISATLLGGLIGVSGKLSAKQTGLVFKPSKVHINKEQIFIPFNRVVKIEKGKTFGIIPNGLRIKCPDITYDFTTWQAQKLIDYIQK